MVVEVDRVVGLESVIKERWFVEVKGSMELKLIIWMKLEAGLEWIIGEKWPVWVR